MFLFVFNSPTEWCKNYGDRSYSFRDITRFATVYFAVRSYDTITYGQCSALQRHQALRHTKSRLLRKAIADVSVWSFPRSAHSLDVACMITELLSFIRKIVFNRIESPKPLRPGAASSRPTDLSIGTSANGKVTILFAHLNAFFQ